MPTRALRDPDWLRQRLRQVEQGAEWRTGDWATAALERAELQIRWARPASEVTPRQLEHKVLKALKDVKLWNRARPSVAKEAHGS